MTKISVFFSVGGVIEASIEVVDLETVQLAEHYPLANGGARDLGHDSGLPPVGAGEKRA